MTETESRDMNQLAQDLRDTVKPPHKRRYMIKARYDSIRIVWDEDASLASDSQLSEWLEEHDFGFAGANFEISMIVFQPNEQIER